jgi:hypothetical protein
MSITTYDGQTIRTLNAFTLELIAEREFVCPEGMKCNVSANGQIIVLRDGSIPGVLTFVHPDGQRTVYVVPARFSIRHVVITPDGQFVCTRYGSTIVLIKTATGQTIYSKNLGNWTSHTYQLSGDSRLLACVSEVSLTIIPVDGTQISEYPIDKFMIPAFFGDSVFLMNTDGFEIINMITGDRRRITAEVPRSGDKIGRLRISSNGTLIGFRYAHLHCIIIFSSQTGELTARIGYTKHIIDWYFTEDGESLTFISSDSVFRIPLLPTVMMVFTTPIKSVERSTESVILL